ncbi:MAG: hypothetical protein BWX45_01030 [Deltaproteobacteria bacterium ADurb.Bin002]|nr:MAG: hypothetical protein BWX45_01030 [Deltaproteobacteria bacterium ADurb.Bin002]
MAVVGVPLRPQIQFFIVRDHHAAFAGRQGLVIVEAEDAHIAEAAELFAFEARAATLGVVFQNHQLVFAGDPHNLVDLRRRTAHVNGNDRFGVARFLLLDFPGIEIQRVVDVAHHRNRAHFQNRFICRQEREGRHQHFVAGAHVHRGQCDFQRRRTGRHAQRVFDAAVLRELLFQPAHLEDAFSFLIKPIAHQDAGFQHVHHFLDFFLTDQFSPCHTLLL